MNISSYKSHAEQWENKATIRTRPRRIIEDDDFGYYPEERQPLCFDSIISKLDKSIKDEILLQSLYKYIDDVITFETEIVNKTALDIAKGNFPFDFTFEIQYDAMSVVIDENYHAFVAMDFRHQLELQTGVKPIHRSHDIELSRAIPRSIAMMSGKHKYGMELIAVAISENTITEDVAAFSRDTTIKRCIKGIMADHLADEGRHSKFWINVVRIYWQGIDDEARIAIGSGLPKFIEEYLTNEIQNEFDRNLISSLEIPEIVKDKVISNMTKTYPITSQHPMITNIRRFLVETGILSHQPTATLLSKYIDGVK
ncbi:MAG: diiron oxygenase [Pseudomonadales bacterium]|nr:diiron oxygenase [Pseudomonadales bacterium]